MMFIVLAIFSILLHSGGSFVNGSNILGLMSVASPSHHIWNSVLLHRLAELGHNVTVLSVDIPKASEKVPPNLHYIHLEEGYSIRESNESIDLNAYMDIGPFESVPMFYGFGFLSCSLTIKSKGLQTLLNYPKDFKFDLVIHDYTIGPCLLGFVHRFNYPPLVGVSAFHNPPNTIDFMSNHYFPAYVPYHSTTFAPQMNFLQRLENTLIFIYDTLYRRMVAIPQLDAMLRQYFDKDMPYLGELTKHTAISLVNSHPAVNYVEPLPPNVIEVGGMQIIDPKPLPKDLEAYMNSTKKGAVFISFGTNMKSKDFTEEQVHTIVEAISQLPEYNFLWKFDTEYLKEKLPQNALVRPFFPQRDILAHPKLKAFVTHCGGLSSQESIWRGVPMIGVPLYFDQHRNLRQSMLAGTAVKLNFLTMTSDELRNAIKKVIEDPVMRRNVKAKAIQFRDRPMRPLDTAVWWVEYLLRNPDPYHLRSPAAKLNIFQSNSLDCLLVVLVALLIALLLLGYIAYKTLRILRSLIGKKNMPKTTKLKKN